MWLRFASKPARMSERSSMNSTYRPAIALLEREVAQRRDEEVRLARAGAAVEQEPLRRRVLAELAGEVLGDGLRALRGPATSS